MKVKQDVEPTESTMSSSASPSTASSGESSSGPKKRKPAARQPKDPKKPRGRMTAYAFFIRACRDQFKEKDPEKPFVFLDFSRNCAQLWKGMSDDDKKEYVDNSAADLVRYQTEMKGYVPPPQSEASKGSAQDRKVLDPYLCFIEDNKDKLKIRNPTMKAAEIKKMLTKMWDDAGSDVKTAYENSIQQRNNEGKKKETKKAGNQGKGASAAAVATPTSNVFEFMEEDD